MKQFIVTIFLCVAFCALVNAAQRKVAYERGEKIIQKENEKPGVDLSAVVCGR
jgi:hypothetical protein